VSAPRKIERPFGTGACVSSVIPVTADADVVAGLLPKRLVLAPVPGFDRGTHPLLFVFHRHVNAKVERAPWVRFSYLELVVGVPHVKEVGREDGEPLFFMPKLRLNQRTPLFFGYFYGFAKDLARIDGGDDRLTVRTTAGAPLFTSTFAPAGAWSPAMEVPSFVTHMAPLLMLKLVGLGAAGLPVYSSFECVPETARIMPLVAEANVAPAFVASLAGRHAARSISEVPFGAFRIEATWRLSFPSLRR
jgi:hypothetical protein